MKTHLDKLRTTVSKEEATINQHCVAFLDSIVGFEQLQNRARSPPSRSKEIILFHGADSFGFVSNKKDGEIESIFGTGAFGRTLLIGGFVRASSWSTIGWIIEAITMKSGGFGMMASAEIGCSGCYDFTWLRPIFSNE